jgi:hypothetical protein
VRAGRISKFLHAHHLQALDREGFNIGPSERPGRTINRLAGVARDGKHEQYASRRDEVPDMQRNGRTKAYRQSLSGVGLHDEVEVVAPLGGRIQ